MYLQTTRRVRGEHLLSIGFKMWSRSLRPRVLLSLPIFLKKWLFWNFYIFFHFLRNVNCKPSKFYWNSLTQGSPLKVLKALKGFKPFHWCLRSWFMPRFGYFFLKKVSWLGGYFFSLDGYNSCKGRSISLKTYQSDLEKTFLTIHEINFNIWGLWLSGLH